MTRQRTTKTVPFIYHSTDFSIHLVFYNIFFNLSLQQLDIFYFLYNIKVIGSSRINTYQSFLKISAFKRAPQSIISIIILWLCLLFSTAFMVTISSNVLLFIILVLTYGRPCANFRTQLLTVIRQDVNIF